MSVKLQIYTAIINKLKEIPEVKTKGIWNNQFNNEAIEQSINYPCVFIEFSSMEWVQTKLLSTPSNLTQEQSGMFEVVLHCGFHTLSDNELYFPTLDAVLEKIYRKINLISGANFTPLKRAREIQDVNHDNVQDWQIAFAFGVEECGATSDLVDATEGGMVTIGLEIEKDLDIDNYVVRTGDGLVGD